MFLSRLCPCYTVPRFALTFLIRAVPQPCNAFAILFVALPLRFSASPGLALAALCHSLPLLGYESVTIVILKNTEVKSKWIRKRKFGVLHKRRGFVLCVSHK